MSRKQRCTCKTYSSFIGNGGNENCTGYVMIRRGRIYGIGLSSIKKW